MQCKKRNGNNLKNEIATEILVNYFFSEIYIFPPRNTEIGDLTETLNNSTSFNYFSTPQGKIQSAGPRGGAPILLYQRLLYVLVPKC